ncbi:unnamed protein product [Closterium sp. NIES-53]
MFTRRPKFGLYTLTIELAQVVASGQLVASCSCRLLTHQTLLWHHRLGHPSLPRLRSMHSRLLVSGLPMSPPPLPRSPAPPCLPCVEGRERAAPHPSSFPPATVPLQTLHMNVWGPARISGPDRMRYFLLENGISERCIGLIMEVACTSMIHAAAPYFLWPFAVRYAAHHLNLWPCVSVSETLPTLRWTGEVGNASTFCQRSSGDPRLIIGKGYRLVSKGLGIESQCVHFVHPSARGCQRSTGEPRLILGKGYRLVVLGGHGRTDPLLNKPFYPNGLVVGILTRFGSGVRMPLFAIPPWTSSLLAPFAASFLAFPPMRLADHIALRYFLARELHQRGQIHLAYVASRANTADIFTKALLSSDHQCFSTALGLVPTLPHLLIS